MSETKEVAIEETQEQKFTRLKDIRDRCMKDDPMGFWTQLGKLAEELREKYTPQALNDVALWHATAGSGIEKGREPTKFDTDKGEIEAFLVSQEKSETKG